MRPPDWMVWLVILAAAAWFADRRWPGGPLRPVGWNAAIGLASVYSLNGLAILAYGMTVLGIKPFIAGMIGLALVAFGPQPLMAIGLFDTWVDFRRRLKALEIARRMQMKSGERQCLTTEMGRPEALSASADATDRD